MLRIYAEALDRLRVRLNMYLVVDYAVFNSASECVFVAVLKTRCLSMLSYGLVMCPINNRLYKSLNYTV